MSGSKKGGGRKFVPLGSQDDITTAERPDVNNSSPLDLNPATEHGRLRRGLSARQVQMIAVAGE